MPTAQNIIDRALRILRVTDSSTDTNVEDSTTALDALNVLLAEWHVAQIGVPDYVMADLTTESNSDAADRDAIAYQLAIRIAPEYGVELSPAAQVMAAESFSRLRLRYFQPGHSDFSELPRDNWLFDIQNGVVV